MNIDRPFLEKFNNNTFFTNIKDFGNCILQEINNILNSRLPIKNSINRTIDIKFNPFLYGITDITSMENSKDWLDKFSEHIKQCILSIDSRIEDIDISNLLVNKTTISFSLKFTVKKQQELLIANLNINRS